VGNKVAQEQITLFWLLLFWPVLQYGHEVLDPETSTLWFAGKQMAAEKKLSDYLGRHEKTKVGHPGWE
jgi:hypothetical protein